MLVLGMLPYSVESELYILLAVSNWACTSSPTTSSYFPFTSSESILFIIIYYLSESQKWWRFTPKTNQRDETQTLNGGKHPFGIFYYLRKPFQLFPPCRSKERLAAAAALNRFGKLTDDLPRIPTFGSDQLLLHNHCNLRFSIYFCCQHSN